MANCLECGHRIILVEYQYRYEKQPPVIVYCTLCDDFINSMKIRNGDCDGYRNDDITTDKDKQIFAKVMDKDE